VALKLRAASDVPSIAESLVAPEFSFPELIDLSMCTGHDLAGSGFQVKFERALRAAAVPVKTGKRDCCEWLVAATLLDLLDSASDEDSAAFRVGMLVREVWGEGGADGLNQPGPRFAGSQLFAEKLYGLDDALSEYGASLIKSDETGIDSVRAVQSELARLREEVRAEAVLWLDGYRRRHPDDDLV
jgi:hypothetical protein